MITTRSSFRKDIEGLRALAVLAVMAFHFQTGLTGGGFIGVDVFFVISGYLITGNILTDLRRGSFSFKRFYLRRARRLFPALFVTVTITLMIGMILSPPRDLQKIAESAAASILSVSNIYFWKQSGYFDSDAIQKPLLHTWSLAVEEQFYFVWPLITVFLLRYAKTQRAAITALSIVGILSFYVTQRNLTMDPSGVFYLMPYRTGEFAIGAICAWIPSYSVKGYYGELFSIVGLGAILYPIFGYTEATSFPGLAALPPCLGTALLIYFNNGGISRGFLSNPVMTGCGRISYSLYLMHWPIFVMFRQWKGSELNMQETLSVILLTFTFAVLAHRFVEQPFRTRSSSEPALLSTGAFVKLFCGLTFSLIAVFASIWVCKGWLWRYPTEIAQLIQETDTEIKARFKPFSTHCLSKNALSCDMPIEGINVFVTGDSHAPDIFNALVNQYPKFHYIFTGVAGCPPLVREDYHLLLAKHPNRTECIARNEKLLYKNQLAEADLVVINTVFAWYKPEHLTHTIMQIRKATTAPIVVFGNYLIYGEDFPNLVVKHGTTKMDDYYAKKLSWNTFAFENELETLSKELNFSYISKKRLFCENDSVISCPLIFNGKLFTYDRHHLSLAAAIELGRRIETAHGSIFHQVDTLGTAEKNQLNY